MIKCDFCQYSRPNDSGKIVCGCRYNNNTGFYCEDAVKKYSKVMAISVAKPIKEEETKKGDSDNLLDLLFGR